MYKKLTALVALTTLLTLGCSEYDPEATSDAIFLRATEEKFLEHYSGLDEQLFQEEELAKFETAEQYLLYISLDQMRDSLEYMELLVRANRLDPDPRMEPAIERLEGSLEYLVSVRPQTTKEIREAPIISKIKEFKAKEKILEAKPDSLSEADLAKWKAIRTRLVSDMDRTTAELEAKGYKYMPETKEAIDSLRSR